jgi:hypothetical protein
MALLCLAVVISSVIAGGAGAQNSFGDRVQGRDKVPPSQPGNFQTTGTTTGSVSTSWTGSSDNVGVAGYALYLNGAKIASVSPPTLAYTFTGLSCGVSYRLAVAAFDRANNSSTKATLTQATAPCQPPSDATPPAVSGVAKQGQTLTSTAGTWNGTAPMTFGYQWLRCDTSGGSCASIAGASTSSYQLQSADVGSTVRSQVTATNPGGASTARSSQTATVQASAQSAYDQAILADHAVAYWAMTSPGAGAEQDLTGHGHTGSYKGGTPTLTTMMNGDTAVDFNGSSEYMTVASSAGFSIPTTGQLTWEAWIRPDTLQWSSASDPSAGGYVNWIGKCQNYSPSCEWEGRMYASVNPDNRCNRLSAYVFNSSAGYGSGAYWQPQCNLLQAGQWLHVVGEYQTITTPTSCDSSFPGTIDIWVNGVYWGASYHYPTGCMSQYSVSPTAGSSPLNIGTNALDSWFPGAIGKVAIYSHLLSQAQISAHFQAMSGAAPSGACNPTCTTPVPTQ